jgi:Protein of unknown function (DUF3761)
MRLVFAALAAVGVLAVGATAASAPPPGATALCRDGTYSFSQHHSGTCSHHGGVARWLDASSSTRTSPAVAEGRTVLLGTHSRSSGCRRGAQPDRRCSPGAYYSLLTLTVICGAGFHTSAIRDVPQSEKFAVEREYGMAPAYYGRSIEIDHIVPLELGGSNDIANLFPEPGSGAVSYHVKDQLENRLHDLVCGGAVTLTAARRGIATNWEALYHRVFGAEP